MSFVLAAPDALVTAASDLAGLGSSIGSANAVAAPPTTGLLSAAADEVSTQIAALFSDHASQYQQLSARAAAFHAQFVQALGQGASAYTAAESNAVQALTSAAGSVNAAANSGGGAGLFGAGPFGAGPFKGGLFGSAGPAFSHTFSHALDTALLLAPTGGAGGVAATASTLLKTASLTNAAATPAALAAGSIGNAIENLYNTVEPWVQYAFNLLAYAVGFVPFIGILAPQINFLYALIEPIVQSVLFNTLDFLDGSVSLVQGLANISSSTAASFHQFVLTEINWVLSFLPPLPPI